MDHKKTLACAVALALGFTTIASGAPPLALDSEAKADAAFLAALQLKSRPLDELNTLLEFVRTPIEEALQQLNAATTPAALSDSRNGLTFACANGGVLSARLARSFPRTLKLDWSACKLTDRNLYPREFGGSAEVLLLTDSFTPDKIGAIRLGTRTSDLIDKRHRDLSATSTVDETRTWNLRMVGLIPMKRATTFGPVVGEFAYELTGIVVDHEHIADVYFAFDQDVTQTVEHLLTSGNRSFDDSGTVQVEEARYYSGKVGFVNRTEGNPDFASSYIVDGFKLRREQDLYRQVSKQSLDGRIDLQYPTSNPIYSGCQSGSYAFKTLTPIVTSSAPPNQFNEFDTGDLLINGTTRARIYTAATVPPGLPVPVNHNLIHLEVARVGTFDYDVNGSTDLRNTVQCWY